MYHLLTIRYKKLVEGKTKRVTEQFLVEAVGLVEIDKQIVEIFKTRIRDPRWRALKQIENLTAIIFHSGTTRQGEPDPLVPDPFFEVKASFFGDKITYIVPARDSIEAIQRTLDYDKSLDKAWIGKVQVTKILGVWNPTSELWQGDFLNRAEMLYELGHANFDRDQLAKEVDELSTSSQRENRTAAGPVSNQFPQPEKQTRRKKKQTA